MSLSTLPALKASIWSRLWIGIGTGYSRRFIQ